MMVTPLVTELGALAERVQDQATNENSPYRGQPILDESSRGKTFDELRSQAVQMRQALVDAARTLPDTTFESQPADAGGNEVWSAGEVVTHCNFVLMRFAERATTMIGIDQPGWSDELLASGERRVLDKDATIAAAELIDLNELFGAIPHDVDLESSEENPALGKVSGRVWLHFIAVHEANHVEQLEELRVNHS